MTGRRLADSAARIFLSLRRGSRVDELAKVARELYNLHHDKQKATSEYDQARRKFMSLTTEEYRQNEAILPVRTIEVPDEFFEKTGMDELAFVLSRFPGWQVEHRDKKEGSTIYVFRKDPNYMPDSVEIHEGEITIRVSKEVSDYTPEIDWDTLKQERPDLYKRLAKRRMVLEVNEGEFNKMVEEDPHEMAVLERHLKVKEPSLKVRPRKLKEEK